MEGGLRHRIADIESVLRAAIAAADPAPAVKAAVARHPELAGARVHVVAIGKAAVRMCEGALEAVPSAPASVLIVTPRGGSPHTRITGRLLTGGHPVPDDSSLRAGGAVFDALRTVERSDVVLVLLSGGASSLCVHPLPGVTLGAYANTVTALLRAGADIHELNTVRRQIDALKGGGMAARAAPARVIGFIVSDVPGDDPASIASGPLTPSPTDAADACRVLRSYDIPDDIVMRAEAAALPAECFERVSVEIVLSNADARRGAAERAEELGYRVVTVDDAVTGEARVVARELIGRLRRADEAAGVPTCLVAGGETTVTVAGTGRGGRNQELVLAAALGMPQESRVVIGAVGTDGVDGSSEAAGAIADCMTVARALALGISAADALGQNDSGSFFEGVGGAVRTGPTGTNVMDVIAAAYGPLR